MTAPATPAAALPERHRLSRREAGVAALVWGVYGVLGWASWVFDHHWFTAEAIIAQFVGAAVEAACWFALTFPIFALAEGWTRGGRARVARLVAGAAVVASIMGSAHVLVRDMAHVPAGRIAAAVPTGFGHAPDGGFVAPGAAGLPSRGRPMRDGPPTNGPPVRGPVWLNILNALALCLAVFGAGLSRAYARQAQLRRDEAARREALLHAQREEAARREATLQAELANARLEALRRQLDPHFLFNTLNAISALVARDPAGVRSMIARLSELLRFSLEGADRAEIPLREELAILGRYVEIMQVRLQGRLVVEQRVDDRVLDALVPTMVLQPIVENAIRHGVERRKGVGHVLVEARVEADALVLRVTDDGPGPASGGSALLGAPSPARGAGAARRGIGLANTAARLAQLYGDAASFALARGAPGGAVAEIRLPRRAPAAAAA